MIGCNYWRQHAPCSSFFFSRVIKRISFCKCQKAKGHHVRLDSEVNECELELGAGSSTACAHRHASAVGRPHRPSCEGMDATTSGGLAGFVGALMWSLLFPSLRYFLSFFFVLQPIGAKRMLEPSPAKLSRFYISRFYTKSF